MKTDVLGLFVQGSITAVPLPGIDCLVPSAPHSDWVPSSVHEPFLRHQNLALMVAARTTVFLSRAYHWPGTLETAPHLHQLYDFWVNSLTSFLFCVLIGTMGISSKAGFMWGIGRFSERVSAHELQKQLRRGPSSDPDRCRCAPCVSSHYVAGMMISTAYRGRAVTEQSISREAASTPGLEAEE